jgi:hypothetical protein
MYVDMKIFAVTLVYGQMESKLNVASQVIPGQSHFALIGKTYFCGHISSSQIGLINVSIIYKNIKYLLFSSSKFFTCGLYPVMKGFFLPPSSSLRR